MIRYICRYCEEKVSPRAHTCPHCGEPEPAIVKVGIITKASRMTGIMLITLSALYWCMGMDIINSHPIYYAIGGFLGMSLIWSAHNQGCVGGQC